jgi:hypothetical protein
MKSDQNENADMYGIGQPSPDKPVVISGVQLLNSFDLMMKSRKLSLTF